MSATDMVTVVDAFSIVAPEPDPGTQPTLPESSFACDIA